jgi:hypothetical protein
MPTRLVFLLLVVLSLPAGSQHTNMQQRINQRIDQKMQRNDEMNIGTNPSPANAGAARLQVIHQDAEEFSALSATVQSDLQNLQKGLLPKDLHENLKRLEKLSKKLRRDMEP